MARLSAKHQKIYDYIVSFTQVHGYAPTVREICTAVGLRSPSTVHLHLKTLQEAGLIHRDGNKMRSIQVNFDAVPFQNTRQVPILGVVTAGLPITAVQEVEGYLPYHPDFSPKEHFALRVRGDSMTGAGILDGDLVVVRRQPTAENGQIVVALLEDEATVKRLYRKNGEIWLLPENDAYQPIDGTGCSLLGRVCTVIREYD